MVQQMTKTHSPCTCISDIVTVTLLQASLHITHFVPISFTLFLIGKGEKEDVYSIPYGSVTLELISKRAVEGGLSDLINT